MKCQVSNDQQMLFTEIYVSPTRSVHQWLWYDLSHLVVDCSGPWLLARDFNALLNASERWVDH